MLGIFWGITEGDIPEVVSLNTQGISATIPGVNLSRQSMRFFIKNEDKKSELENKLAHVKMPAEERKWIAILEDGSS